MPAKKTAPVKRAAAKNATEDGPVLRGDRVTLRPMTHADAPALIRWGNNADFAWFQWGRKPGRWTDAAAAREWMGFFAERHGKVFTIDHEGRAIRIHGRPRLVGRPLAVPGDLSSAVFFLAAALVLPESNIVIHNVGLNPTRSAVLDVLGSMGAAISLVSVRSAHGELVGDVSIGHNPLRGGVIEGDVIAQLIDELPAIAVLGPYTEEGIEIRNAAELRVKESDRIAALAENLRAMGAKVEERPDGLRVEGRSAGRLHGAEIEPRGDHRMAMAFAVAALGAEGDTTIRDAECAGVSYPDFFATLERLVER